MRLRPRRHVNVKSPPMPGVEGVADRDRLRRRKTRSRDLVPVAAGRSFVAVAATRGSTRVFAAALTLLEQAFVVRHLPELVAHELKALAQPRRFALDRRVRG